MPWPNIGDFQKFVRQTTTDEVAEWALAASIAYGETVLGSTDELENDPSASAFNGCLEYAAALYTARNGGVDLTIEMGEGSTPLQRYRKLLLVDRPVGFA